MYLNTEKAVQMPQDSPLGAANHLLALSLLQCQTPPPPPQRPHTISAEAEITTAEAETTTVVPETTNTGAEAKTAAPEIRDHNVRSHCNIDRHHHHRARRRQNSDK